MDYYQKSLTEDEFKKLLAKITEEGDNSTTNESKICYNCGKIGATKCCRRCKVNYCDRHCQMSHWEIHQSQCMSKKKLKKNIDDMAFDEGDKSYLITSSSGRSYLLYIDLDIVSGPIPRGCIRANSELGFRIVLQFIKNNGNELQTEQIVQILHSKTNDFLVALDSYNGFFFQLTPKQIETLTVVTL